MKTEKIVLAGGCFWCLEPVFKRIKGVQSVICGYTGGTLNAPTYDDVCTGKTGHAEAIKVEFDSGKISLSELLDIFFKIHDPTTLNRQGADIGTQYRSAIFYDSDEQLGAAKNAILETEKNGPWKKPTTTTLERLTEFFEAEEYHQDFFTKNPNNRYCQISISPKLSKLESIIKNNKT
ncbi:peptide-methionine (S)-S-oxide reductase MsrA [Pseudomonas stutzeri]|uniref:peptide-methionine (S)-S-oxide reductase MsrA n=1 Tax=Stutzerimonas stutzeri TaxID=316 RepID=UPI001E363802|nr:peptide-methionine (S)-S-oxide reductase MsrA [Stutzerimonas stutzeri]MCC8345379.1 peptide-methionine (S)-S-oxide reductase MsrA [Stutzerimonas stutzeri]